MDRLYAPWSLIGYALIALIAIALLPQTRDGVAESARWVMGRWTQSSSDQPQWMQIATTLPSGTTEEEQFDHALSRCYDPAFKPKEVLHQFEELVRKYPSNIEIAASYIDIASLRASLSELMYVKDPQYFPVSKNTIENLHESDPIRRSVITAAQKSERLVPHNAFFILAQAVAYEGLREGDKAVLCVKRAANANYFNNYSLAGRKRLSSSLTEVHGANPFRTFYIETMFESGPHAELIKLARWWARDESPAGVLKRALLIRSALTAFRYSQTVAEARAYLRMVRDLVVGNPRPKFNRSPNDAQLGSLAGSFSQRALAQGISFPVDLVGFVGSSPEWGGGWEGRYEATSKWFADVGHLEYTYPNAVGLGAVVFYGFVALIAFVLLYFALSLVVGSWLPRHTIPFFVSFALSLACAIGLRAEEGTWMWVFGLAYILLFGLAWDGKWLKAAMSCGFVVAIAAGIASIAGLDNGRGYELIPALAFVLSASRFWWISQTEPSTYLLIPSGLLMLACIACVGWGEQIPTLSEALIAGVISIPVVLLITSAWQSVTLRDAARQLVRSAPYAVLFGVAVLGYSALQQREEIEKMTRVAEDQQLILTNWKSDVAEMKSRPSNP